MGGALKGLFGAIDVRTDLTASSQAGEVIIVASCVLRLITFALQQPSTFQAHFAIVLLRDQGFAGVAGSRRVSPCGHLARTGGINVTLHREYDLFTAYMAAHGRGAMAFQRERCRHTQLVCVATCPPPSQSTVEIFRSAERWEGVMLSWLCV